MLNTLEIKNISYTYPGQVVPSLLDVSFCIAEGEKFALLGPNGAGKTTLMSLLTGVLAIQKGSVTLFGNDLSKGNNSIKQLLGYVPQDFAFYQELSPKENLEFFGALSGLSKAEIRRRTEELLEIVGLTEVANKPVSKFSGGMKRRVNLAIGVIHKPRILFLDEPTVGVDVQSRLAILDYLKKINQSGTTLVYTSHQLNEAELLCDRMAMIDEGKIIALETLKDLSEKHKGIGLEDIFIKLTGNALRD